MENMENEIMENMENIENMEEYNEVEVINLDPDDDESLGTGAKALVGGLVVLGVAAGAATVIKKRDQIKAWWRRRKIARLNKDAAKLGYNIVAIPGEDLTELADKVLLDWEEEEDVASEEKEEKPATKTKATKKK